MKKICSLLFAIMIVFALALPVMAADPEITVVPEESAENGTVTLTAKTFGTGMYAVDCWLIGDEEICMTGATLEKIVKDEFDADLPVEEQYWLNTLVWTAPELEKGVKETEFVFTYKITLYDEVTVENVETDVDEEIAVVEKVETDSGEKAVTVKVVEAEHPAATAVAVKLLAEAGVSHRYGKGKDGGNYIADVAKLMGKGASFMDVDKEDFLAYKEVVKAYLISVGALSPQE